MVVVVVAVVIVVAAVGVDGGTRFNSCSSEINSSRGSSKFCSASSNNSTCDITIRGKLVLIVIVAVGVTVVAVVWCWR